MADDGRRRTTDFQQILELVGPEPAALLCKHFGGSHVYIPQSRTVTRNLREAQILSDRKAGMSYRDLGRKWSMTKGGVLKLVRRVEVKKKEAESDGEGMDR
jgi:Mor family transcriptional regulator